MKKRYAYIFVLAAGLAGLTACSTDDFGGLFRNAGERISFTATTDADGSMTRGVADSDHSVSFKGTQDGRPLVLSSTVTGRGSNTTRGKRFGDDEGDELTAFRVSAIKADKEVSTEEFAEATPDFFYNLKATKNANNVFEIEQDYYWPSSTEKLWFYAYTYMPYTDDNNNVEVADQTTGGAQKVTFAVDANVDSQVDLMTAEATTQGFNTVSGNTKKASVPLTFQHELTAIRFVIGEQWLAGSIKSVAIRNVHGKGTLTIGTHVWEWKDKAGTAAAATDAFKLTLDKTGVAGGNGEEFIDDTNLYFLMIPQSFDDNGDAVVEVVYQDGSADYTVTAPLKGQPAWVRNTTVTYAISSHTLTTLKINSITWPTAEWAGAKSGFATNDKVGLYVVDTNNEAIVYHNIPCSFNGTTWNINHETTEGVVYHLPGYQYFFYYPYQETMATSYPLLGQGAGNSTEAKDFFSSVINGWVIPADQRDESVMKSKDLQVAKATDYTNHASTVNATMTHTMAMAKVELQTVPLPIFKYLSTDANYQWNDGTTQNCTASGAFQTYLPYGSGTTWYYLYNPKNVSENHTLDTQSITMTTTGEDGWSANVSFTNGEVTTITPSPTRTKVLQSYTMNYGDVLYSDGALSACNTTAINAYTSSSRVAIGIVSSKNAEMSQNDKDRGWTHGVAFAANIAGQSKYGPNGDLSSYGVPGKDALQGKVDKDGYNETNALKSLTPSAMKMAWEYSAINKSKQTVSLTGNLAAATGRTACHWYLPSCGQIIDILVNIAGLPREPDANNNVKSLRWSPPAATTFLNKINAKWQVLKNAGYSASLLPTGKTFTNMVIESGIYSSTPYTHNNIAFKLQVWSDDACWFDMDSADDSSDDSRSAITNVLPVVSF